jgi:hypothetical protein
MNLAADSGLGGRYGVLWLINADTGFPPLPPRLEVPQNVNKTWQHKNAGLLEIIGVWPCGRQDVTSGGAEGAKIVLRR